MHMGHHKHLHSPAPCSCPNSYRATPDSTSTCTSHLPPPALSPTCHRVTSQAPAQPRGPLPPCHLLRRMGHHKHLHMPLSKWLLSQHVPFQEPEEIASVLQSWHLSSHQFHRKRLQKPGPYSCPMAYSGTLHIVSTCTSQLCAPALSATEPPATLQAAAQASCFLLAYQLLSHQRQHKHLHRPGVPSCPISFLATSDITRSSTSQLPAPALPTPQAPATSP